MSTGIATTQAPMQAVIPKTVNNRLSSWVQSANVKDRLLSSIGGTRAEAERFLTHALVSFQTPQIMACTPESQLKAMFELCALGLLPSLQQAALIVRGNAVTVMPQWQGYQALMLRNPETTGVLDVEAHLVHVRDECVYANGTLKHSFNPFDESRTITSEADIVGGYLKVTYRDGRPPKYHFVPVSKIIQARECSAPNTKTGKRPVWERWFYEQALKTIYRNAYQRRAVPVDPLAAHHLEAANRAEDIALDNDPLRGELTDAQPIADAPKQRSKVEAMAAMLDAQSEPVDVTYDGSEAQTEPEDMVFQDESPADSPLSAAEQAEFTLEQWTAAVQSIADIGGCRAFIKEMLPAVSESVRPQVLKCVNARIREIKNTEEQQS